MSHARRAMLSTIRMLGLRMERIKMLWAAETLNPKPSIIRIMVKLVVDAEDSIGGLGTWAVYIDLTRPHLYSKGTLLGTPNREPREYSRNI